MKNTRSFKSILILSGLTAALLFVVLYFFFREIRIKNEHASILENEISSQAARQIYLTATQRTLENISSDINNINNSIIASDSHVEFIERVEGLAEENGLTIAIDALSFEENSDKTSPVTTLKIRAKVKGEWSGMYRFLSALESLPVKIRIDQVALTNSNDQVGFDVVRSSANNVWQTLLGISVLKYK